MKISIVITVYNYERYVGLAIDSALNQTRSADEIVVVDDGSSDGSREIIAGYGDRIRAILQANQGNIAAFEVGYRAATGDVLLFLDADDILMPTAVENVAAHWREGISKVQFNLDIIDSAGRRLGRSFCAFPKSYAPDDLHAKFVRSGTYIWPVMSGNAYSRGFLRQVIPLNPPVGYDGALNTIAPLYGDVVTVQETLGQYRLHGRNISRNDAKGQAQRFPDFPRQIGFRVAEFDILKAHCDRKSMHVQAARPIDNEIVFVNYRLASRKLGLRYVGQEADTSSSLLRRGIWLALTTTTHWRAAASHVAWFIGLFLSPSWLAYQLIMLRFNRAELLRPLVRFGSVIRRKPA
ncbi:glycosyltransferase [Bradyrhizobium daqingense]|uniref:Glycosyl transferase family 2 n=1 Tax=Bradyrhizobium daqingense TaxID=993502 RepID=A0A562KD40_9BRAD|nr:glycosyltransferase [Bradyrhizobium daqingense]TWH93133.1 glycosyl transferase family 2 [Bradyrhizobium daqingense]UFS88609.1 glycosyltransferase [Bradyrhizobium daqingense]